MNDIMILLDTGVLGILINSEPSKNNKSEVDSCNEWLNRLLAQKILFAIPEIADYEERRELIRRKNQKCLQRLEDIRSKTERIAAVPTLSASGVGVRAGDDDCIFDDVEA